MSARPHIEARECGLDLKTALPALDALAAGIDRKAVRVTPNDMTRTSLLRASILNKTLSPSKAAPMVDNELSSSCWTFVQHLTSPREEDSAVEGHAQTRRLLDRSVGAMVGMALGDAVGAPLEFIDADGSLPHQGYPANRPHVRVKASGELEYVQEYNKFSLERGQWTDDAAMGLALADSLLCKGGYMGGDARIRWWLWWNNGSCNAFRFNPQSRGSVGLGGNISQSLDAVSQFRMKTADKVPPLFNKSNEDAGNGSIMRLAAVPIGFAEDIEKAMEVSALQSLATHPGPDAAACCQFMTFLMIKAFYHPTDAPKGEGEAQHWVQAFMDSVIGEFLEKNAESKDSGCQKLMGILKSQAPSPKEAHWDWRHEELPLNEAVRARLRGGSYNGYPVLPGYWGAYSMDAMAMSLWSMYYSDSLESTILRATNLLGDADTVAAIAAQMAGALFGYASLQDSPPGRSMLRNLNKWDPYAEIALRGALLQRASLSKTTAQNGAPEGVEDQPPSAASVLASRASEAPQKAGGAGDDDSEDLDFSDEPCSGLDRPMPQGKAGSL